MKTFKLNENGDVVLNNNKIEMVNSTAEIVIQTLKQVLNTNLKEWFGDEEEGIDYSVILTKNPNYDLIHETIETAVQKVAEQLGVELETDNFSYKVTGRQLKINLDIALSTGESETLSLTV